MFTYITLIQYATHSCRCELTEKMRLRHLKRRLPHEVSLCSSCSNCTLMRRHGLLQQPMPLPSLCHMRPTASQLSGMRMHATQSARVMHGTSRSEYCTHSSVGDQLHPSAAALRHLCRCCLIPRGRVQETTLEIRTCQLRHRTERHK